MSTNLIEDFAAVVHLPAGAPAGPSGNSSSDEDSVEEMSAYICCQSLVELFAAAVHLPADTPAGPNGNSLSDEESAANQECMSVWGSFLLTALQQMCACLQMHQQAQVATAYLMKSL